MPDITNLPSDGQLLPARWKTSFLIQHADAIVLDEPEFQDNLVCVQVNETTERSVYCATIDEFNKLISSENDHTSNLWLIVPGVKDATQK